VTEAFGRFARRVAAAAGSPWAALLALAVVVAWVTAGLIMGFSDTLQLVINTGTTIVTFLMVFVIQASQNRDAKALHLKLDAIIASLEGADDAIIDAERQTEEEVESAIRRLSPTQPNGGTAGDAPGRSNENTARGPDVE
jgi:low affinity Fe/Cu permease